MFKLIIGVFMKFLILVALLLGILSIDSKADHRNYVWTYQYMIMTPGEAEFENYTTFSTTDTEDFETTTATELNFELEIGMSDSYDFAVYQNFKQDPAGNFKYNGYKLRSRFKIGEKDQFFMDPLIYVEYKGKPNFSEHEFEVKLILAKDLGDFNIALNPYVEMEYEEEWEAKPKYAAGVSYLLSELLTVGIEAKGSENGHYVGPTISHGKENLWVAIGSLFEAGGLKAGESQFSVRFILGVGL